MSVFLTLAFLFFVGSVSGWLMELIFRRFFSRANPERKKQRIDHLRICPNINEENGISLFSFILD